MTKESIILLQEVDCNCNDCIFMIRDIEKRKRFDHLHQGQLNASHRTSYGSCETDHNEASANYGMSPSGVFLDMIDSYGDDFLAKQADFLRSKGYAIPFDGSPVPELIEYGYLKIKGR